METLRPDLCSAQDTDLLAAAMSRDERAWEELLRRYRPLLFRCILRVVKRYGAQFVREDVNEIFGDVCVAILHNDMHKLRIWDPARGARLGSWLGLLAIHVTHDHLRQQLRRPQLLHREPCDNQQDDPLRDHPAVEPSALEQLLEQERWLQLRRLLQGLSPRDRHFVELYYGYNLPPETVATCMGISVKTVYSKKNKLRMRLLRMAERQRQEETPTWAAWPQCAVHSTEPGCGGGSSKAASHRSIQPASSATTSGQRCLSNL